MIIQNKTDIVFGSKALDYLEEIEDKKIVVITDKFLHESGLAHLVIRHIEKRNSLVIFDEVEPDPSLEVVSKGLALLMKNKADYLLAIGGGSVIDAAKGIIYFGQDIFDQDLRLIAIPTTSGTGSEVTSVSVITDKETKRKHLLQDDRLKPDVAILDNELTKNLPKKIVGHTGIDVLSHSLEAYVGTKASAYSDALAEKSGELLVENLLKSYTDQNDLDAKDKMHQASMLAGLAFENGGLGLNHSIAHQLGGFYHIPHGLANGIVLNEVIDFNSKNSLARKKYAKYTRKIGLADRNHSDEDCILILKYFIDQLQIKMDMPRSLSDYGLDEKDHMSNLEELARNVLKDNCIKTTPLVPSQKEVVDILKKLI